METVLTPEPSLSSLIPDLHRELDELSHRAIRANLRDLSVALELAQAFEEWTSLAVHPCGEWSRALHLQAQEMAKDLRAGWPVPKTMEQLLRAIRQAHRHMDKEQSGVGEEDHPGSIQGLPSGEELGDSRNYLYVRAEDQGLFQMVLQESPTLLSGLQSNLLLLNAGQPADLSRVHQIFRVLQGQWGFLGFLQMRDLCRWAQLLLEPSLSSKRIPEGDHPEVFLRILGTCRSQTSRIAGGLPEGRVEVLDATPLLEEIKNRISVTSAHSAVPVEIPVETVAVFAEVPAPFEEEPFFRVGNDQMEEALEFIGDLTLAQSSLMEEASPGVPNAKGFLEGARAAKLTRQLRDLLLSARMAPIRPLFDQLSMGLTQLSQQAGKAIRLSVEGPETEMDKRMIPLLASPLAQLLKNAVDHGIETAGDRQNAGKPAEGMIKLKASHQAGSLLLEVEDDGRGLDMEKLRKKGQALGILEGEKVTSSRVMEMIFKPGVTTLETSEEGRGVGLDRVEEELEALYGSIRVQSRSGQGCRFVLKIPRTQALIEGWVVEAGKNRYLLPLSQIRKITHPTPAGAEKPLKGEEALPVVDLDQWLGEEKREGADKFSVHVESGSHPFRILVDEVVGKQQVLVRKMRTGAGPNKVGVRGEVILADGKPGWILDTREMVKTLF